MAVRNNEALVLVVLVGHLLILLLFLNVLLVDVLAVLLGPFILRVHLVVKYLLVFLEGVSRADDSTPLVEAPVEVRVRPLNCDALRTEHRCLRIL